MKLELMALVWALGEKFREYLYFCPFIVLTDNNPLSYFMTKTKLSATEQKWAAILSKLDFKIQYRSGKQNASADALSRQESRLWEIDEVETSELCGNTTDSGRLPLQLRDIAL